MISLRNISIKNKLILIQVFTSLIVLGLCCIVFVITDVNSYKERKVNSLNAIAQVIGANNISAIQFLDNEAATKNLSELGVEVDILNAAILTENGGIFARYTKSGAAPFRFPRTDAKNKTVEFKGPYLYIYHSIIKNNKIIGTVCLQVELSQLEALQKEKIKIATVFLFIGIALSFLIALIVQRGISAPLLGLVQVMQNVKNTNDYKTRSKVNGKDEIHTLSLVFNDMLEQIEKREQSIKERSDELLKSNNNLVHEISIRKKTEGELIQKSAELERSNTTLNEFAYVVSHDLKAPLRGISSLTTFLYQDFKDVLGESGKEQLSLLLGRVSRMDSFIEGILKYSRVGRIKEKTEEVDLNELLNDVVTMISPPANIQIKIETTLPKLACEKIPMGQVFQNLIDNAIKYMDKPEGIIKVGMIPSEDENVYTFYVSDNGPGIEEKFFEKIFQIFQKLTSRDEHESTGIGLTIVKKIIEINGGKIWLTSKVGEGTTFYFTFPKYKNN